MSISRLRKKISKYSLAGFFALLAIWVVFVGFDVISEMWTAPYSLNAPPEDILHSRAYTNSRGDAEVQYAYATGKEVPPSPGEDVSRRTPNSQTYVLEAFTDENGQPKEKRETAFFSKPQIYEKDGKWVQIEYATTTARRFSFSGAIPSIQKRELAELLLPGKPAFATASTFYPNANPESTSVDGYAFAGYSNGSDDSSTTLYAGELEQVVDTCPPYGCVTSISIIYQAFILFDTSSLPDTASISAATMSIYILAKTSSSGNLYLSTSTPASNTAIVAGDYGQRGSTQLATSKTFASLSTSAYNDYALNASGLAELSVTGITKYGVYSDFTGGDHYITASSAETSSTTQDPKLVVTYTVDSTAPTPNPMTYSTAPTGNSTSQVTMTSTAGSDAGGSTPIQYQFDYNASCAADNGTGGTDSSFQTSRTYNDTGLQTNKCYAYRVRAEDSVPNIGSYSSYSAAYTLAATPGSLTYSSVTTSSITITNNGNGNPTSNPNTAFAVLVTTSDGTWNNKYVNSSGSPSASAQWLTDAQIDGLALSSLVSATSYTFKSKARNGDSVETSYGSQTSTTTLAVPDTTAPTPNPMTFSSAPATGGTAQVDMTATTASDAGGSTPIQYYFAAVAGSCGSNLGTGGTDSGWQAGTSYSDTGLQTNRCYAYTVQARDSIPNTGTASSASGAYTTAATPGAPSALNVTGTTITINNAENGNPSSNPTTEFAVRVTTSDGTWNNKYTDSSGNPSASAVWLTDAQIDGLILQGLQPGTSYTIEAKARNGDSVETGFGAALDTSTSVPGSSKQIRLLPGSIIKGGVRFY